MQNPDGLHADYGFSPPTAPRIPLPPHQIQAAAREHSNESVPTVNPVQPAAAYLYSIHQLKTMPYQQYLLTEHWKRVRQAALVRAGRRCQLCNSPTRLEVHHRTYERRGAEQDGDVTVLCATCHGRYHGRLGASPYTGHYSSARTKGYKRRQRGLGLQPAEMIGASIFWGIVLILIVIAIVEHHT